MRPRAPITPPALDRWIGAALIGAGLLGLLLSLAGLIFVAVAGATAESALMRELATLDRSLAATNDGLAVADSALADTRVTLASLSTTIDSVTKAITETQPAISALQELTGSGLPQTIGSTRQALASAQETARIVDGVLSTIAVFGVRYDPDVPLNVAIGRVSDSLAELPTSLEEVSVGLSTTSEHITTVTGDLEEVATGIDAIAKSVGEATTVIDQYQTIVGDLRGEVAAVREAAPGWTLALRVGLTLLLIWLGLAQVGPLTQGWELLQRDAARRT